MAGGLIGNLVPGLPGTPLVLLAAMSHRLYFGQASVNNLVLIALAGLMVIALGFDYFATVFGAKKFGATWRGAVGAVLGGMIGLFFSLPGIVLAPFLGSTPFEM